MLSKKIHIAVGSILAASLMAFGVYKGYEYVQNNYVILSMEEVEMVDFLIAVQKDAAFQAGQASCSKGQGV